MSRETEEISFCGGDKNTIDNAYGNRNSEAMQFTF